MKRFLSGLLFVAIFLCSTTFPCGAVAVPSEGELVAGGLYFAQLTQEYSVSFTLLAYSLQGAKSVYFGKNSDASQKLMRSPQLIELAHAGVEGSGAVSFYPNEDDLAYGVGLASYTLTFRDTETGREAVFVVRDTFDFDEIRGGGNLSDLLNDIGYILQHSGDLHTYEWSAEVIIPLD